MKSFLILGISLMLSYAPFALAGENEMGSGLGEAIKEQSMSSTGSAYRKTITNGQYIGGGVASIFIGLGIPHAIQGRWSDTGWIFTLGDTLLLGGAITILATSRSLETWSIGVIGLGAALRIWQIIDAWNLPSNYKIVKRPKFQLSPLYTANYRDMSNSGLGLNLKYNF